MKILLLIFLLLIILILVIVNCSTKINGMGELIAHKTGKGDKLMLLISGLGEGKESYKNLQNILIEKFPEYTIISFDQPGFGDNANVNIPKTFDEYTKLLRDFGKPNVIIGHSFGGRLAQYMADTSSKVLLLDPTPDYVLETAKDYQKDDIISKYMNMVDSSLKDIINKSWDNMSIIYDKTSEKDNKKINFYKSIANNSKNVILIESINSTHWIHIKNPDVIIHFLQ